MKPKKKESGKAKELEEKQLGEYESKLISSSLQGNMDWLKQEMGESDDLIFRELELEGGEQTLRVTVIHVQCVADDEKLDEYVIGALQSRKIRLEEEVKPPLSVIKSMLVTTGLLEEYNNWKEAFAGLFIGRALILVEGVNVALGASVPGGAKRGVEEPKTQLVIRGPREGFTESIRTNTSLIRRKIRSPKLWLEQLTVGEITQTPIGLMYIKGLADDSLLSELKKRLGEIEIDGVLESSYIEELISDQVWTPFPTLFNSERPDVIAAGLLEGKVAILVDGTPFVLMVPAVLNVFFQSSEDYYQRFDIATLIRLLRYVSFFISLMLPSVYVAILGFHQEMIPTQLLLKLAAQREGVPFPAYLEAFIMEFVFEILREAVIRMPSTVGSTISIVGGLVIGQSVVEAGIVSPAVVIVVSLTAITSFVSPSYNLAIAARMLRFLLLAAASTLGFYGIALVLLFLVLHLSSIRSFGVPYLTPFAPTILTNLKDTIIRVPMWQMKTRPKPMAEQNPVRGNMDAAKLEGEAPQE
ncbi:spore germination protein [Paenibacillus sp. GCM10023252]|uniref:spore germination protein n=1 Tax=Paenibacillus sp. GCM10023252 TaxID=3252649 RepID=UPI00362181E5